MESVTRLTMMGINNTVNLTTELYKVKGIRQKQMVLYTRVSSLKICPTGKDTKYKKTEALRKDNKSVESSRVKESKFK